LIPDIKNFLDTCLSVDLEINPNQNQLIAFAAVANDGETLVDHRKGSAQSALEQLEKKAAGYRHLIGHNVIDYDLPHLASRRPSLSRLGAAPIDTLWLNPLAYPRNPYHHLVKHHQDASLITGHVNDPVLDAKQVFEVLSNQIREFQDLQAKTPDALVAYHYLSTMGDGNAGFDAFFRFVRDADRPDETEAHESIRRLLEGKACRLRIAQTLSRVGDPKVGWPIAYALAWVSVAGGDSVMPPWVRFRYRDAAVIVRHLRDNACGNSDCAWCAENNDPRKALDRWFGFESFREYPADSDGRPFQEKIVSEAMRGKSALGILPTGTGKSICYQIPALSKFDRIGAMTVVISPLVALMADQVGSLKRTGINSAVTVNGQLSLPERHDALDQVVLGDASILLISPEQLRSTSVRSALRQREVGLWVLDEAHCVSKWGHDFRPDYRYIGRFIREYSGGEPPAPILCLTATAKPQVIEDIRDHFSQRVGLEMDVLDGGGVRTNLSFEVRKTDSNRKISDLFRVIEEHLPDGDPSGAIIYCATRKTTEKVADLLVAQGISADRFHAGLTPDGKATIQEQFRVGELRVIAATNAFGMGIDKPDIRLVVHYDIPSSLESYLQEAGRAGRDTEPANCVLLFDENDVERQFSLTARSRLTRREIAAVLKALRRINDRTGKSGEVIATSGEIVREETDQEFERDSATDDTRVKTAVSWLEEAILLSREENRVRVFPSSLLVRTREKAEEILDKAKDQERITSRRRDELLSIIEHLMNAAIDEGVSTDDLVGVSKMSVPQVTKALRDLETLGIATDDTPITAFVHSGIENASSRRLDSAAQLEGDLISLLRQEYPDAKEGEENHLDLAEICQLLREHGHATVRPDIIETYLRGLSFDGRDTHEGKGNIHLRKISRKTTRLRLERSWNVVEKTAHVRRKGAQLLLAHLVEKVEKGRQGADLQVETTLGKLREALPVEEFSESGIKDIQHLMDRALLWLHEHSIITLGKGLTVFRPAMIVHLNPELKGFLQKDFAALEEHYGEQTLQIHVMAEYAQKGLESMPQALQLTKDYFEIGQGEFLKRWLPNKSPAELRRQTTSDSWKLIVKSLDNAAQEKIVEDNREQTSVLVLAGPGSGKTRVLVHRIAYLIRIRRENPRGILVLTYNRHAAVEIRARLKRLVGDDAAHVTVLTCHALAMRLMGYSYAENSEEEDHFFKRVLCEATRQLTGRGLSRAEAEALRDTLIQGYRWLLVDEYQDIGQEEYELIAAVAGRSINDPDLKLSLFAVGDDDQNIYSFKGASVRYIRRFEQDYRARRDYLTENYRSTRLLIDSANQVIAPASERMKDGHDIRINRDRERDPPGGEMAMLDPVAHGRVRIIRVPDETAQAIVAVEELCRLSKLDPDWSWNKATIIAREWRLLEPVRSYAEEKGIPVECAKEGKVPHWRLREMRQFIEQVRQCGNEMLSLDDLFAAHKELPKNKWSELVGHGLRELELELTGDPMPKCDVVEWFGEWSRDLRGIQAGLLLVTAHSAKGLEFDHVVALDGKWDRLTKGEDPDAPRRLFYVASTRARKTFTALALGTHPFLDTDANPDLLDGQGHHVDADARALCGKIYPATELKSIDLGFAGRLKDNSRHLPAIESANVGDELSLVLEGERWVLKDSDGIKIGRMAKAYRPPKGTTFHSGRIRAIIRQRKSSNDGEFWRPAKRDEWDVVLPELVFAKK